MDEEGNSRCIALSEVRYIEVLDRQLICHCLDDTFHTFGSLKKTDKEHGKDLAGLRAMMCIGWAGIAGIYSACDYNLMTNASAMNGASAVMSPPTMIWVMLLLAVNRMVSTGTDQYLPDMTLSPGTYTSPDTPAGVRALRNAIKNTLYTVVNDAVPGDKIYYKMSPWRVGVIALDAVIALGILPGITAIFRRSKEEKEHSELFRPSINKG